jgi:DNA-binding NarL/FixJ family response regulator
MMIMKKNVLIVDGQTMLTDFLVPYLEQEFPNYVFNRAASTRQAQQQMSHQMFDVVITDLFGLETTGMFLLKEVRRRSPCTPCIVLSTEVHSFWVKRALDEGAMGFVSKMSPCVEIVSALKAVQLGMKYLSPEVSHCYINHISSTESLEPLSALSPRELEVFIQVGQGKSFQTVSKLLNMSVKTVAVHKHNIARKTGIDSIAKIALYCAKHGLLTDAQTKRPPPSKLQAA